MTRLLVKCDVQMFTVDGPYGSSSQNGKHLPNEDCPLAALKWRIDPRKRIQLPNICDLLDVDGIHLQLDPPSISNDDTFGMLFLSI